MINKILQIVCGLVLTTCLTGPVMARSKQPEVRIVQATALPVAIDDAFEFRKTKILNNDDRLVPPGAHPSIGFEKSRVEYGAITPEDLRDRKGHYYSFFWKAARTADVTVRFEYRQTGLGSHVQAREVAYSGVRGSHKTEIQVTGDDFHQDGRVLAWRALLVVDGKIAAITQSYLWK